MTRVGTEERPSRHTSGRHDRNEVLSFRLLAEQLAELLPIVYDPTIVQDAMRTAAYAPDDQG